MDDSRLCTFAALALSTAAAFSLGGPAHAFGWMLEPSDESSHFTSGRPTAAATTTASAATIDIRELGAVIMQVTGHAKWRPTQDAALQVAKVNDILKPGAQIQTGVRSSVALRIGKNATVIVDGTSSVILPEVVQDGGVLRTRLGLAYGNADVKVDHVGFSNDFEVVTPSSVISVRGTGFRVGWGAFEGSQVSSFDGNRIRAIELKYFGTGNRYFMDARTRSSNGQPDPGAAALYDTIGPPPLGGAAAESAALEQYADLGSLPDRFAGDVKTVDQAPGEADFYSAFASASEIAAYLASLAPKPSNVNPHPVVNPPGGRGGGTPPPPGFPGQFLPAPTPPTGPTLPYNNNCHCIPPVIVSPPVFGGKR